MPDAGPTVAITGATGFIGQRVLERLVSRGYHVLVLSRRPPKESRVRWVPCDLSGGPVRVIPEAVRVEPPCGAVSLGWFDITGAREHLGFSPAVSIEHGLERQYVAAGAGRERAQFSA